MDNLSKSSSAEQMLAEDTMFPLVEQVVGAKLEKNRKIFLSDNAFTYIQPDFYSEESLIIGEIFAHIGKPKKAQNNKIANDILKMLLLEQITGKHFRKIIAVCDKAEAEKLRGMSVLAESIRQFQIEVIHIDIDAQLRKILMDAQKRQRMTNA